MKFWVLLVLLLGLVAFSLYIWMRPEPAAEVKSPPESRLSDIDYSKMEPQVAAKLRRLHAAALQSPGSAVAWGRLGMNLDVHGLKSESTKCYTIASDLDSNDFRWPYYNAMLLKEGGSDDALQWFERSEQRDPKYVPLQIQYAIALKEAGRTEESAEKFRNAIRLDPSNAHGWLGLAELSLMQGDLKEARSTAERAAGINPKYREAHNLLAGIYRGLGDSQKASAALERAQALPDRTVLVDPVFAALAQEGESAYWYRARGRTYLQTGFYELALKEFEKALQFQQDAEAYDNLGVALQGVGRLQEAIAAHQKAIQMKPTYLKYLNLGLAYGKVGDLSAAEKSFRKSIEMNPDHAESHYNLGITYFKRSMWPDSIDVLKRAVKLQPTYADAHYLLVESYFSAADRSRGCQALQRFLQLRPSDPRATKLLSECKS